jgi:DNA (cytosine-5)-methyltransferase 1
MNLSKQTLLNICFNNGIVKCKSKNKIELIALIEQNNIKMGSVIIENTTNNEPTNNEPTNNEPTNNEPTNNEPTNNEPTNNEPTNNEPTNNEPTNNEPTNNEPTNNEPTNNEPTDYNMDLKFIDLFCGIGGFHQAMKKIKGKCVFACDIDEKCRKTYEQNYILKPQGDISKINFETIPDFNILCGGFPCQSFSNSGKKKGFEDERGKLFEYILQIAILKKPQFMFLENVKHIKKIDNGQIFKHIKDRINKTGYYVETIDLSPHQLGIPQQRERVVFICIRNDIYDINKKLEFILPNVTTNFDSIFEPEGKNTEKYKISQEEENILVVWDKMIKQFDINENLSPTILCNEFNNNYTIEEMQKLPNWKQEYIAKNKNIYSKYKNLWDNWLIENNAILTKKEVFGKLEWQVGKTKENDSIFNHFIQFRQSGIRVKKTEYFPTLVAIVQTPIYAKEKRYITPRECARLQSFPDDFILHESDNIAYKQFGNAVNVDVVHFVISNTLKKYNII